MKRFLLLFLLVSVKLPSIAQFTVEFITPGDFQFTNPQLWSMILYSNYQHSSIHYIAEVNLTNSENVLVASSHTKPFLLGGTKNMMSSAEALQSITSYYSNDVSQSFMRTGILLPGKYRWCFRLNSTDEPVTVINECTTIEISSMVTINLVQPPDDEQIYTTSPLLIWNTLPVGNYIYKLRLAEMGVKQSSSKALRINKNYLEGIKTNSTSINYPARAPLLKAGSTYAWQVICFDGDKELAQSEVWKFSVQQNGHREMPSDPVSYRKITMEINRNPYFFTTEIKFVYDNWLNEEELSYNVMDLSNGQLMSGLQPVSLIDGENQIDIATSGLNLVENRNYLLTVINPNHHSYLLSFIYAEE